MKSMIQRESSLTEILIWGGSLLLAAPLLIYLLYLIIDFFNPMPPFEG